MILIIHPQHCKWNSKWDVGCQGPDVAMSDKQGKEQGNLCVCKYKRENCGQRCNIDRLHVFVCKRKTNKALMHVEVCVCERELAFRVDVHMFEQITEHKCTCVYFYG